MPFTIGDLRDRLPTLDIKVADAEREAAEANLRVQLAKTERAGAEAFIQELEKEAAAVAPTPVPTQRRRPAVPGVTAVVETIVTENAAGIDVDRIREIARERGHDFDAEQVRSALSYLRRRGDVERLSRGVWRPKTVSDPQNSNDPTGVGPFELTSPPVASEVGAG